MKHSVVGLTPKQALLVNAIGRQLERNLNHLDTLRSAAREAGLSELEAISVLDTVIADTEQARVIDR